MSVAIVRIICTVYIQIALALLRNKLIEDFVRSSDSVKIEEEEYAETNNC